MNIHRAETIFIRVGAATMLAFFAILVYLAVADRFVPPSHQQTIDPATVTSTAPFDHPGLVRTGPNSYDAYYVARAFSWSPQSLTIPLGSTVTFYVTSLDVVHGFTIPDEDVNVEVMPGWVSTVKHTFLKPGKLLLLCNQYCGIDHSAMYASVTVK